MLSFKELIEAPTFEDRIAIMKREAGLSAEKAEKVDRWALKFGDIARLAGEVDEAKRRLEQMVVELKAELYYEGMSRALFSYEQDPRPLGEQALYVIREAGERAKNIDRAATTADRAAQREVLRARVDEASIRPTPGTSHLLTANKPLAEEYHGVDSRGKPGTIKVYDCVGSAPVQWCRKGVEKRKLPKGKEG